MEERFTESVVLGGISRAGGDDPAIQVGSFAWCPVLEENARSLFLQSGFARRISHQSQKFGS